MRGVTKKFVIVGGVAAGATAAARIRRLDEEADIVLLERGPYVSFANCGLPYHIAGEIEKRSKLLLQTPEGFFSRYRVTVRLNSEVVSIDRTAKTVTLRNGDRIPYDYLILAQGGVPIMPSLPGVELPHVFKLWTIPDMDAIHRYIKEKAPKSAVVVGGGFIGLETAEAFVKRGLQVSIVELMDRLMPHLDLPYGRKIQERFEKEGASVFLGTGLSAIEQGRVILQNGTALPADLVLLSVGVRPNVELAKNAGLALGATGALEVDSYLRTKDPYIWAAGDMVEVVSRITGGKVRIPLAGPANRQGRIAATNAVATLAKELGLESPKPISYRGALGTSVVKIFDETVASTGLSLVAAKRAGFKAREATILKPNHATYYPGSEDILLTLVYEESTGRLLGAEAQGKSGVEKRIDAMAVALSAGLTVEELAEVDFAYAPPYSSANDPLNIAAFAASNARSGYCPMVSAEELHPWIVKNLKDEKIGEVSTHPSVEPLFLDVRTFGEYQREHLRGSIHIPLDEVRDRWEEIPQNRPIRVISSGGYEGHLATRLLMQKGVTDVANCSGGWAVLRLVLGSMIERN
ncbi:MAG: FAD-dependent oxidoreductase [Spirochaetes bacterium]|nr:FAD-dependent oxidoreductase [Spirochaetota bacterium]